MTLILALNYSSRWEITTTIKKIAEESKDGLIDPSDVDEAFISRRLATAEFPDPELLIRTSGEQRISNYLLWQIAYSELYFTDVFWPDFRKVHLYKALVNYQGRE
jgi:undecaprenyl diphosphate synthase